jgi:hypothetical protein
VIRCGLKPGEMRHARRRPTAEAFFHARVPEPATRRISSTISNPSLGTS